MTKAEYDALPPFTGALPAGYSLETARFYREQGDRAYRSMSGTDVAEAEKWHLLADLVGAAVHGKNAFAVLDAKWRKYATEQAARIEAMPRIKQGPYQGQAAQHWRWVSPDAFASLAAPELKP